MEDDIETILDKIPQYPEGRYIIGIDGLSRSGKTTFVKKLNQSLIDRKIPHRIIHIDDHITARMDRYDTGNEEWYEHYQLQWDVQWLKENLFNKIKSSNSLKLPFYQDEQDRHITKCINLPEQALIIIEGVFLQRNEWVKHFDFIAYLHCSRNDRFQRESDTSQENIEKFYNRYWKAEDFYLRTVVPLKKADFVIES
ncbi:kinase [Bacillus sp. Marseille-Q3570]|uniref:kinase n=1 Tax=Bacillus sp. Marseille-Q3570 TaxID=2963522 RepID=UPI0021B71A81|nr:kinase [Bacillus sp. Marseille-Q3570]